MFTKKDLIRLNKGRKLSKGENLIVEFLKDNNIYFIREYYFTDLKIKKK